MSYSQHLVVPHPRKHGGDNPVPLGKLFDAADIQQQLAEASSHGPDVYDDTRFSAAQHIAGLVNSALWYPKHQDFESMHIARPLSLDEIADKQVANCYGYTLTTSELYETAGIDHWIGYANGHAFTVLPPSLSTRPAYLVDPLEPRLSQSLERKVSKSTFDEVAQDITKHRRGAIALHTDQLVQQTGRGLEDISIDIPWLIRSSDNRMRMQYEFGMSEERISAKRRNAAMLIMSVFPRAEGKTALENLVGFENSLLTGNTQQAVAHVAAMAGLYPELDARDHHGKIRALVHRLCEQRDTTAASTAIEHYMSSFSVSRDPRLAMLEGDCWRQVYVQSGGTDERALKRARLSYQLAAETSRYSAPRGVVMGKLARVGIGVTH